MKIIDKVIMTLMLLTVLCVFVVLVVSNSAPTSEDALDTYEDVINLRSKWTLYVNDVENGEISLPARVKAKAGDVVKIQIPLEEIMAHASEERSDPNAVLSLCTRTSQQFFQVYFDDNLVYSSGSVDNLPFSKTQGSQWNFIDIDNVKEHVSFVYSAYYNSHSGNLNDVYIGTRLELVNLIMHKHGWSFLLSALLSFCGLVMILVGIIVKRKFKSDSLLFFGLFCFLASFWSTMEARILDLFVQKPFLLTQISFLCLSLCPFPFIFFVKNLFGKNKSKTFYSLVTVGFLQFIIVCILQLFNIADFIDTIFLSHTVIVAYSIYTTCYVLKNRTLMDKSMNRLFVVAVAVLVICACADVINFQIFAMGFSHMNVDNAFFFRFGFCIFMLLLTVVCIIKVMEMYGSSVEKNIYKKMLEIDIMTNMYSRNYFEMDMENVYKDLKNPDVCMIVFDMNNLKQVNDTYGHKSGDLMIAETAKVIKKIFDNDGKCYRIGGDEFLCIFDKITEERLNELLKQFDELTESTYIPQIDNKLSVAYGYGFYDDAVDSDVGALFKRVDQLMYQNKRRRKSDLEKNDRRQ